ncbi:replication initiation protein [Aliarcobacter cryaerophilus]|uniref:replication initiation protein n=1 Tax=Aliarcobacter cryaerophilus TaxID=28198 RepID=UPI003DA3956C
MTLISTSENKIYNRKIVKYKESLATLSTSAPLSLIESKLVFSVISQIDLDDDSFKEYKINASELHDEIKNELRSEAKRRSKLKGKEIEVVDFAKEKSKQLEIFCTNLKRKTINLPVENKLDFDIVSWFERFNYKSEEDTIYCQINPNLKPYLLDLKNISFKKNHLPNILTFKSKYTHKFYLLLKIVNTDRYIKVEPFGSIIPLEWFRKWLGLEDDEYKLYADFKRRILNQVQKDLEDVKCEINFELIEIKTKKAVTHLQLKAEYKNIIVEKEQDETPTRSDYDDEEKKDTDLENQNLEYFFGTHRIIRFENRNYKLIQYYIDSYRNDKLSIKIEDIDIENSIRVIEFNYKLKNKLLKDFILPKHLEYISFYKDNYSDLFDDY